MQAALDVEVDDFSDYHMNGDTMPRRLSTSLASGASTATSTATMRLHSGISIDHIADELGGPEPPPLTPDKARRRNSLLAFARFCPCKVRRRYIIIVSALFLVAAFQLALSHVDFIASQLGPIGWWPLWGPPVATSPWDCEGCGCPGFSDDRAALAAGCIPSSHLQALGEADSWPRLNHPGLWPRVHEQHMATGKCFDLAYHTGNVANASSEEAVEAQAGRHWLPPAPVRPPLGRDAVAPYVSGKSSGAQPPIMFHLYIRMDLGPLSKWPAATISSVLATQPRSAVVVIWSPHESVGRHPVVRAFSKSFPGRVFFRVFDVKREAVGTPLETSPLIAHSDGRGWMDSDIFRLIALYHYGGVYIDTDMILARDISPLLGHEWATEFGCDHPTRFNNAIMRFVRRSRGIETLASRAGVIPLQPGTWAYGPDLLERVDGKWLFWRRGTMFLQVPWCFFHGRWCHDGVSIKQQAHRRPVPRYQERGMMGLHYHGITRESEPEPGSLLNRWEEAHAAALDGLMGDAAVRESAGASGAGGSGQGARRGAWRATLNAALEEAKSFRQS